MVVWTIILVFLIVVLILIAMDIDDPSPLLIGTVVFFLWLLLVFGPGITNFATAQEFITLQSFSQEYPETELYEGVFIEQSKEQMNHWLFKAKASRQINGPFSLYPEIVDELEVIK